MKKSGIFAQGVTVTYRNGHTALREVNFESPTGSITALVGVNGSGKSTLFKAIMGFVRPSKGKIRMFDLPVDTALKKTSLLMFLRVKMLIGIFLFLLKMLS